MTDHIELGRRIKQVRLEQNLSQTDIASNVGVATSTIQRYETGKISKIKLPVIQSIATFLRVNPDWLLQKSDRRTPASAQIPPGFEPMPTMEKVPLIGQIACGSPILAAENVEDYVSVMDRWHADFALKCRGDSMEPTICDGDVVAIRKQPTVDNGEIAAVRINDDATLKRVYLYRDKVVLQAINTSYEPIVLVEEEMDSVAIEGKAVGICRSIQ